MSRGRLPYKSKNLESVMCTIAARGANIDTPPQRIDHRPEKLISDCTLADGLDRSALSYRDGPLTGNGRFESPMCPQSSARWEVPRGGDSIASAVPANESAESTDRPLPATAPPGSVCAKMTASQSKNPGYCGHLPAKLCPSSPCYLPEFAE